MVSDDPESFADLDGHTENEKAPETSEEAMALQKQKGDDQKKAEAALQWIDTSTIVTSGDSYNGQSASMAYKYERTTTSNTDGSITYTTKTTSVYFSNEAGHEGQYLGATQSKRVDTIDRDGSYHAGKEANTTINKDDARASVGNHAFMAAQQSAVEPNRAAYAARQFAGDFRKDSVKYVGTTAGVVSKACPHPACKAVAGAVAAGAAAYEAWKHWRDVPVPPN